MHHPSKRANHMSLPAPLSRSRNAKPPWRPAAGAKKSRRETR